MTQDRRRRPESASGDQRNDHMAGSTSIATMPAILSTGIPYFRSRYGMRMTVTEFENPYGSTSTAKSQGALCLDAVGGVR